MLSATIQFLLKCFYIFLIVSILIPTLLENIHSHKTKDKTSFVFNDSIDYVII